MKTTYTLLIFVVVACMQLLVPAKMIMDKEAVLTKGTRYKFKTRPIDPNDPFRGKYITLDYDISAVKTDDTLWQRNDEAYLYLRHDDNGFATPVSISRDKQDMESDYVFAEVTWYHRDSKEVNLRLPFDRYYMEESKAYDAELAHRRAQRDSLPDNTYALVHIKNGQGVLSDVLINDISIKDYVKKQQVEKGEKP